MESYGCGLAALGFPWFNPPGIGSVRAGHRLLGALTFDMETTYVAGKLALIVADSQTDLNHEEHRGTKQASQRAGAPRGPALARAHHGQDTDSQIVKEPASRRTGILSPCR